MKNMNNMNEQMLEAIIKHHQDMMVLELTQFQIQIGIVNAISGIVDAIDTKCVAYFGKHLTVNEVGPYMYILSCRIQDSNFTDGNNINGYKMWGNLYLDMEDLCKNDGSDYRDIVFRFHLEQEYFNDEIGEVDAHYITFGGLDTWELAYSPDVDTEPVIDFYIDDNEIFLDPAKHRPEADLKHYKQFQAFINSFK